MGLSCEVLEGEISASLEVRRLTIKSSGATSRDIGVITLEGGAYISDDLRNDTDSTEHGRESLSLSRQVQLCMRHYSPLEGVHSI